MKNQDAVARSLSNDGLGYHKFLGRTLDAKTMTYSYESGSGGMLPEEMRQDVLHAAARRRPDGDSIGSGVFALLVLWSWKLRIGIK